MKNFGRFFSIIMLFSLTVFFYSCQKQELSVSNLNSPGQISSGGVVAENPAKLALVPLMISENYLDQQLDNMSGRNSFNSGASYSRRDRTPPVVSISSPVNNATVSGTVAISVSATDDVGVSGVTVYVDGVALSTKNTSPYSFSWNTANVSSGTHVIKATAFDAAGNNSSYSIQVGINAVSTADIAPPSVTITSPVSGSSYSTGVSVSIAASAADNVGVASVGFSIDGVLMYTDNTSPYSYTWNSTNASIGTHTLMATARDAAGNAASNSILVTINTTVLTTVSLPASFQLNMPPVQNQGGEGSCVAFSTTYAARSAEKYYQSNASAYNYGTNVFSPEFVYDQTKASTCGSGTGITTALDFLKTTGVCSWQTLPYSSYDGCTLIPTSSQLTEAYNNKIVSYSRLMSADSVAIKNMLLAHHPVIISIGPDQSFINAQPGFIWKTLGAQTADHSLVICGYDDGKHAYKVMNSWGTGWGDAGYSWIDYTLFPQSSFYYSYVIGN